MNKVIIKGNICKDIELRFTKNNVAITNFNVAVKRNYKNVNNEYESDFINCIAYKNTAELIEKYFEKGSQILLEGRIQTGSYDDKDGNKRYTTDVIVENIDFINSKQDKKAEVKPSDFEKVEENPFQSYGDKIEQASLDNDFLE